MACRGMLWQAVGMASAPNESATSVPVKGDDPRLDDWQRLGWASREAFAAALVQADAEELTTNNRRRQLLRDARHKRGLSLVKAGELAAVSSPTWSRYEQGHTRAYGSTLDRMRRAVGIPKHVWDDLEYDVARYTIEIDGEELLLLDQEHDRVWEEQRQLIVRALAGHATSATAAHGDLMFRGSPDRRRVLDVLDNATTAQVSLIAGLAEEVIRHG